MMRVPTPFKVPLRPAAAAAAGKLSQRGQHGGLGWHRTWRGLGVGGPQVLVQLSGVERVHLFIAPAVAGVVAPIHVVLRRVGVDGYPNSTSELGCFLCALLATTNSKCTPGHARAQVG